MDWRSDPILKAVDAQVRLWHDQSSNDCMRIWFYENHVCVVADYAARIAEREGMDVRVPVLAALIHDIARTVEVNDDPELGIESERMGRELMTKLGVDVATQDHVCRIMEVHSCRGDVRPDTPEGKAMTTGDAMAHFVTDFYFVLPFNGWLTAAKDFEGYKAWIAKKIQRDFHNKIFFEDERKEAEPKMRALETLFG